MILKKERDVIKRLPKVTANHANGSAGGWMGFQHISPMVKTEET
jgi:hypothetical protein